MTRRRIATFAAAAAMLGSGAFASSSSAAFHEIRVSEIHNDANFLLDYFELQMYSDGQSMVMNHHLRIYDGAGAVQGDYPVPTNLGNGQSQRTFTIGNTAASDYNYGGANVNPSGAVCWNEIGIAPFGGVDCVSWGTFVVGGEALSSPAGANAPVIGPGQTLQRKLTPGCATLLEAGDDTNNSAADFILGAPTPRNNAVTPTEKPCTPAATTKCKKAKKKKKGKKGASAAAKCKKKKKKKKK